MTPRRLLSTVACALAAAALLAGCTAAPLPPASSPEPSSSPATAAATPAATPTPTPTPTADAIAPTCENTATAEFRAMMTKAGRVAWIPADHGGGTAFDSFPGGPPPGQITCTWGDDPDLGTDNIIVLAWAPIAASAAAEAQERLAGQGYERIESAEGVYLAMKGDQGWADDEGYAQAYLFTGNDVRWAMYKDEVAYVKAPDQAA